MDSWRTESEVVNRWIEPAVREAERKTTRSILLRLLRLRFGSGVSMAMTEKIETQTDLQTLENWFDAAITAPSPAAWLDLTNGSS
jgi:hypothetical protein